MKIIKCLFSIVNFILILVLLYYAWIVIYVTISNNLLFLLPGEIVFIGVILINILSHFLKVKENDNVYINKTIKNKNKEERNHNDYGFIDYWDK